MAAVAVGLITALFLCLYRLEIYPSPWFDEGLVLWTAKNIARGGGYGLPSDRGFMLFHPAIQTGPTVILPIAFAFRLLGTGFLQARLVTAAYALVALAAFHRLAREMDTPRVALLASALLVCTFNNEFTSFIPMGRQVLGEVPALAFFWLGTGLWFSEWERLGWLRLSGVGLLWGLAMVTKVQFTFLLPATLLLFGALDWRWGKEWRASNFLIPLAIGGSLVLAWYGYQALAVGPAEFWRQSAALRAAGSMHFLHFPSPQTLRAIYQILRAPQALFGIPGIAYALGLSTRSGGKGDLRPAFLATFAALWLIWYAFFSIGWGRYAFVPLATSTFFSARLLADLWAWGKQGHPVLGRSVSVTLGQAAVGGVALILALSGFVPMVKQIVQAPQSGLEPLVEYLNGHVPTGVVIESWEWQVDVLTDHTYHHPSYELLNMFTGKIWQGTPLPADVYDPLIWQPEYLIVGPFARWTGIYSSEFLEQNCSLVMSAGEYELYRVRGNR